MRETNLSNIFALQFWGVFLVVLGHSMPYKDMTVGWELLFKWIYAFHMPLFFSMSGYLYNYGFSKYEKGGGKKFIIKKIKRLVIPFIFLNAATLPVKFFLESFTYRPLGNSWYDLISCFLYLDKIPIGNLWFVIVLFHVFIVFHFLIPKPIIKKHLLMLPAFLLLNYVSSYLSARYDAYNILGCITVFRYLLYFYLGMLIFDFKNEIKYQDRVCLSFAGYILILGYVSYLSTDIYLAPFIAVVGVLSSFGLASFININHTNLSVIAKNSYQIYLLSWFPQVFVRIFFV